MGKTGQLETHLDLPAGGVLATPDRTRRARVVLRLAVSDSFTKLGYAPHRAPLSATITQRVVVGGRIDATPLAVPLLGVHAVVIGSPGSGKSTTLLTLADALTACADAVVWDLDPAGDGLPSPSRLQQSPDNLSTGRRPLARWKICHDDTPQADVSAAVRVIGTVRRREVGMGPAGGRPGGNPLRNDLYVSCTACGHTNGPLGEWPDECPCRHCKADAEHLRKVQGPLDRGK